MMPQQHLPLSSLVFSVLWKRRDIYLLWYCSSFVLTTKILSWLQSSSHKYLTSWQCGPSNPNRILCIISLTSSQVKKYDKTQTFVSTSFQLTSLSEIHSNICGIPYKPRIWVNDEHFWNTRDKITKYINTLNKVNAWVSVSVKVARLIFLYRNRILVWLVHRSASY